jgi:hypothetical protein
MASASFQRDLRLIHMDGPQYQVDTESQISLNPTVKRRSYPLTASLRFVGRDSKGWSAGVRTEQVESSTLPSMVTMGLTSVVKISLLQFSCALVATERWVKAGLRKSEAYEYPRHREDTRQKFVNIASVEHRALVRFTSI